ncbi:hypothetical protein ZWY2020_030277 [Hordeum vulgare]|nr:hypothetical protein ZWY2020_030277 [Hordeum vulgare]
MSHVLDDATSAAHDTMPDDAMLDTMRDHAMLDTMPDDAMLDTMPDDAMLDTMPDDAMLDTMPDDAMPDTALPLGAFLDTHISRVAARCDDTSETADTIEVEPATMPELPVMPDTRYVMEGEIAEDFLAYMLKMSPYAKYMKDIVTNKRRIPEVKRIYYITSGEAEEYEKESKAARLREAAIQAVAAELPYNPDYDFGFCQDHPWE